MSVDLDAAKQKLLTLQEEYETRIEKIKNDIQNPQDELNKDWEDQAISIRQNDTRQLLAAEAHQNLIYVKNALGIIANGTYGECEVCGKDIQPQRLEAVPYATLCMDHAE
ncbi:DnaK suppressor protein [Psychrobacter sp. PL15]|uniref:TraR/DksA family transcriptional regulator n=1 Tax=Psychrobacter sp. PL15 TaxID=3071719 RepID=UPI002DFB05FE|nr:DnaK suppressor protein [Psychrobacter sp. PL15]